MKTTATERRVIRETKATAVDAVVCKFLLDDLEAAEERLDSRDDALRRMYLVVSSSAPASDIVDAINSLFHRFVPGSVRDGSPLYRSNATSPDAEKGDLP